MKRLHLIIAIVAFIALLSSSCTVEDTKTSTVLYKVTVVESNTKMIVGNTEAKAINESYYVVGDTIWINTRTKKIDPTDSIGMKAVVQSIKGIIQ